MSRRTALSHSAGGLVVGPHGKILVVNQNGDSWSLPKGHIDPGETAMEAARREIAEESGVESLQYVARVGSYVRTRIARGGGEDPTQRKRLTFFLFSTAQTRLRPTDPHNPEARWVDPARVASLLTHPKDRAFFEKAGLRALQKAVRRYAWRSPVGWLRLEMRENRLARMEFASGPAGLSLPPAPVIRGLRQIFSAKDSPAFSVSLVGTPFQKKVWKALLRIPRGRTISYADLAGRCGFRKAVQAVANAVGANPVCLVIPCHRVIASDGSIGGYAYGVRVKRALLKLEGVRL